MANVKIAFTKAVLKTHMVPVVQGDSVRSEILATATDSVQSTLQAADGENIMTVIADDDVWVAIGTNPTAANDLATGDEHIASHFCKANIQREFWVETGYKIAVI